MHTPKDVLHAIDTDSYPFGIANIDDNNKHFTKTKPAYTPPPTKRK